MVVHSRRSRRRFQRNRCSYRNVYWRGESNRHLTRHTKHILFIEGGLDVRGAAFFLDFDGIGFLRHRVTEQVATLTQLEIDISLSIGREMQLKYYVWFVGGFRCTINDILYFFGWRGERGRSPRFDCFGWLKKINHRLRNWRFREFLRGSLLRYARLGSGGRERPTTM